MDTASRAIPLLS